MSDGILRYGSVHVIFIIVKGPKIVKDAAGRDAALLIADHEVKTGTIFCIIREVFVRDFLRRENIADEHLSSDNPTYQKIAQILKPAMDRATGDAVVEFRGRVAELSFTAREGDLDVLMAEADKKNAGILTDVFLKNG